MESTKPIFCYYLRLTDHYAHPENWTARTWEIIEEHTRFLDDLGKEGVLIFAGRTDFEPGDQRLFGIALLKAANLESAEAVLADDPAVVAGIQKAEIYPFSLGLRHFRNIM